MTTPAGFWVSAKEGTPDNQNAGLLQLAAFASLPAAANFAGMVAVSSDGLGGDNGFPAVYRSNGSAWVSMGSLVVPAYCMASDGSAQTLSDNVWAEVNMDAESVDTDGFHDTVTNNPRITIPANMGGVYYIEGGYKMVAGANTTAAVARLRNGAGTVFAAQHIVPNTSQAENWIQVSVIRDMAAAEYVKLEGYSKDSGSASHDISDSTQYLNIFRLQ